MGKFFFRAQLHSVIFLTQELSPPQQTLKEICSGAHQAGNRAFFAILLSDSLNDEPSFSIHNSEAVTQVLGHGKLPHSKPTSLHSLHREHSIKLLSSGCCIRASCYTVGRPPSNLSGVQANVLEILLRHHPDFCVFCKLWSWEKRVLYFVLTQRVLCLARPLACVSQI